MLLMIVLSTLVGIMNTVNALQVPRIGAPDYTYPELGNPHVPGAMSFDDQDLVAGRGANRRINRVDLWCGDYVYQMIPFYRGAAGKVDEVSRMYGSNVKNGKWTQLALEDGEYIGGAVYQTCDTSVGNRLCYLQLYKFRDVIGRRYPKFTGTVGCGQPDGPNHVMTTQSGKPGQRFLSFTGHYLHDGFISLATHWIDKKKY